MGKSNVIFILVASVILSSLITTLINDKSVIQAKEISIVDDNDNVVILLKNTIVGPAIKLFDRNGKVRATMMLNELSNTSRIDLMPEDEISRFTIGLANEPGGMRTGIIMTNSETRFGIRLGIYDGIPSLLIFDSRGEVFWHTPFDGLVKQDKEK
jgi:hypothetical protein